MNQLFKLTLAFFAMLLIGMLSHANAGDAPEGQKLFLKLKCNQCHGIKSLGIKVDESIKKDADEEEVEEDEDAPDPPDLGALDPKRDGGVLHDEAWTSKFLQKKVAIKDRNHTKKFKGTKEERAEIIKWLFTLRK